MKYTNARPNLIVGIGASAGGLAAFRTFLAHMPPQSGMAFVLVQHLAPDHKSALTDLLSKVTSIPVIEAEDGMLVDADRVFVIPPDCTLTIKQRRLRLTTPAPPRELRRPIDSFFSSLAEDQADNAVCIVLSGTGSDGAVGLTAVKENGGLTLAQAEAEAEHLAMSGMPRSATATGFVDYVLPVEDMPAKLLEYRDHLHLVSDRKGRDGTRSDAAEHLATITALLRSATGHDFSKYKEKTVTRRVQRRMQVLQTDTVPSYIALLRENREEIELLFRDLLIGVTHFFRDIDAFEALRSTLIEKITARRSAEDPFRVWVPACSTGEEAYSIAILLAELLEQQNATLQVQVFATDLDDRAVEFARSARYRRTSGLTPERLARWFVEDNGEFRPVRKIREICIFSVHSVIKDPPFSRLDLISCRNLLIYMGSELQDRVVRSFHYALNPGGTLFLGLSEGVNRHADLFESLDKHHHIFRRRDAEAAFPGIPLAATTHRTPARQASTELPETDWVEKSARRALAKYAPIHLVVDKRDMILRFSGGEVGRYLEPSPGAASLNLFSNLRRILRPVVRSALQAARETKGSVVNDNVVLKNDGRDQALTVIVEPILEEREEGLFVVAFLEGRRALGAPVAIESHKVRAVELELQAVRQQLQSTIDDLETANEEMKSAAEEYQSVNEELQSSNEELETSKEEMQSINEELHTVNAELNSKNTQLTDVNSDLKNLLASTQIGTLFLDANLRIRNFTPGVSDIFHVRESDRGRPITEIVSLIAYDDMRRDVARVLRELTVVEHELHLQNGERSFIMRMRPYRSIENVVDGVVLTFIDITDRRRADLALKESEMRLAAIVSQATVGISEIDLLGRFVMVNARFCELVGRSTEELQRLRMQDITHSVDLARTGPLLDHFVRDGTPFEVEQRYLHPDGTEVGVHIIMSALTDGNGKLHHGLAVTLPIGDGKHTVEQRGPPATVLDPWGKDILAMVSSVVSETLKTSPIPADTATAIERRIAAIANAHSLLTKAGDAGRASLRRILTNEFEPYIRNGHNIRIDGVDVALSPKAALSLAVAVRELTSNAAKYGALSIPSGQLTVSWTIRQAEKSMLSLVWTESGGPPLIQQPGRRGFGTTLIERALAQALDADVNREFLRSGLRCTIELPLTADIGAVQ